MGHGGKTEIERWESLKLRNEPNEINDINEKDEIEKATFPCHCEERHGSAIRDSAVERK